MTLPTASVVIANVKNIMHVNALITRVSCAPPAWLRFGMRPRFEKKPAAAAPPVAVSLR